jgi:hypothetical protein
VILRSPLKVQEEVVGIVLPARVQDVPGCYLQGVVLGAADIAKPVAEIVLAITSVLH